MAHHSSKTQTVAEEPRAETDNIADLDEWTQPGAGELLPPFRLPSTDGRAISPWDYKGRQSLLLFFFDPRCGADLQALAELRRRYPEITNANAEVLAIGTHAMDDLRTCAAALDLPFPLLADETGEVARDYCVTEASLHVADQYGELECREPVSAGLDRVLESCIDQLVLISIRCPECGI